VGLPFIEGTIQGPLIQYFTHEIRDSPKPNLQRTSKDKNALPDQKNLPYPFWFFFPGKKSVNLINKDKIYIL